MTANEYKALGHKLFEQIDSVTDVQAYNKEVRRVRKLEEEAVIAEAGAIYQSEIDRINDQIKVLQAQKRGLEYEQAKVCKKAWIKHFGDSCGFPTILRMVLGEVIR